MLSTFIYANKTAIDIINYYESKHLSSDLILINNKAGFSVKEAIFLLKVFENTDNSNLRIIKNILIGNVYYEYQRYDTALVFYRKAQLLAAQNLQNSKIQRFYVISLINIAKTTSFTKNSIAFNKNIKNTLSLSKKYKFEDLLAEANFQYAKSLIHKSPKLINSYLDNAESFFVKKNMKFEIQNCYLLRSLISYLHNETTLANEYLNKAFEINENDSLLAKLYFYKANLNKLNNKEAASIENYLKSIELSQKYLDYQATLKSSFALFQLYEKVKLYKKAFEINIIYKEAKDSLNKINSQKKIFLAKIQYKFSNKKNSVTELKLQKVKNNVKLQQHKNNRQILYLISVFFVILFIVIIYFFLLARNYNRRLSKKNKELHKSNLSLKKAKIDLEELGKNKDRFFSIIAHDLRSPFNSVLGLSEYISESMADLEKKEILKLNKMIFTSSKSLYNLLENLLNWSKTQIGKLEFKPENTDLHDVIEKELEVLKIIAANKEINIISKIEKGTFAYFDKGMIATVIRNITNNAIKFTEDKGNIKLSTKNNESSIIVSISDNGIGISQDNIRKLFNANKQFTTSGTSGEKGTGLGLAICKEFVVINNGEINVKSELNKGTQFEFTLPKNKKHE